MGRGREKVFLVLGGEQRRGEGEKGKVQEGFGWGVAAERNGKGKIWGMACGEKEDQDRICAQMFRTSRDGICSKG